MRLQENCVRGNRAHERDDLDQFERSRINWRVLLAEFHRKVSMVSYIISPFPSFPGAVWLPFSLAPADVRGTCVTSATSDRPIGELVANRRSAGALLRTAVSEIAQLEMGDVTAADRPSSSCGAGDEPVWLCRPVPLRRTQVDPRGLGARSRIHRTSATSSATLEIRAS
jgi:hypothetical protein